jgi:hypothetical protein
MTQYNIVYTTAAYQHYLWNGHSFDPLTDMGRQALHYSGPFTTDANLQQTLQQCRDLLQQVFPLDEAADLKAVRVGVQSNEKDENPPY